MVSKWSSVGDVLLRTDAAKIRSFSVTSKLFADFFYWEMRIIN